MASCKIDINDLPVLSSCPPDTAQLLLFNMPLGSYPNGMALIPLDVFRCCMVFNMFGAGIKTISGTDLVAGIYYNSSFVDDLLVYAWNVPNFLKNGSQWNYIKNGAGKVIGIEILIGFDDTDQFTIFPNPSCSGTPVATLPDTINERVPLTGYIDGDDPYVLPWTPERIAKYGPFGNFTVWGDDGSGFYQPIDSQPVPDDRDNPTTFTFAGLTGIKYFIVIG